MKPKCYIIRGLPGSGKSTFASNLKFISMQDFFAHNTYCDHWKADMFFTIDGEYKFDKDRIGQAHEWCYAKFLESIRDRHNVIVSNTFTRKWEYHKYAVAAEAAGYEVFVMTMNGPFKSIHDVPESTISAMRERFEH